MLLSCSRIQCCFVILFPCYEEKKAYNVAHKHLKSLEKKVQTRKVRKKGKKQRMKIELHIRIGKKHLSVGSPFVVALIHLILLLSLSLCFVHFSKATLASDINHGIARVDRPQPFCAFCHIILLLFVDMTSSPHHFFCCWLYRRTHIFLHIFGTHQPEIISISKHFFLSSVAVVVVAEAEGFFDGENEIKMCLGRHIWPKKKVMFSMFEHLSTLHDTSEVIY